MRTLEAFRVPPTALLRHLGKELGIPVPDLASLRVGKLGGTTSDQR